MVSDADVRRVVALMRELGVTKLHGLGLSVELGPAPAAPDTSKPEKAEPEPRCRCGHEWGEHTEAGCANGCALERCGEPDAVPEEAKTT